jgi:hypothetical protein
MAADRPQCLWLAVLGWSEASQSTGGDFWVTCMLISAATGACIS